MPCPLKEECLGYFLPEKTFTTLVMKIMVPIISLFMTAAAAFAWQEIQDRTKTRSEVTEIAFRQKSLDSVVISKLTAQAETYRQFNAKLDILLGRQP